MRRGAQICGIEQAVGSVGWHEVIKFVVIEWIEGLKFVVIKFAVIKFVEIEWLEERGSNLW